MTAQGDPNLHLLPLEGEQGLLGVVQGLQLRSCRRIIKHLVELIPLNSSTGKGLWLHRIKQARKGGWGPSPVQERDKPQEHLVVLGGEGLAYRLVVWVQGHDLPPPDQV